VGLHRRDDSPHWIIEFVYRGVRYKRSSGVSRRTEAQAIEATWREELRQAALHGPTVRMTLSEALERYYHSVLEPRGKPESARRHLAVGALAALRTPVSTGLRWPAHERDPWPLRAHCLQLAAASSSNPCGVSAEPAMRRRHVRAALRRCPESERPFPLARARWGLRNRCGEPPAAPPAAST